jgi:hypothetical protein
MPHHAHSIDRWDNAIGSNLYNTTAAVALSRNGNRTEHNGSGQAQDSGPRRGAQNTDGKSRSTRASVPISRNDFKTYNPIVKIPIKPIIQ